MVSSSATTPAEYLAELPDDRRPQIERVRQVILDNLPDGIEEGVEFGMLSYHVPLERYPDTYNGRPLTVLSLANQKRHMALYLMGVYADDAERQWFETAWQETGHRLDMGKSCVRFTSVDKVPLEVVAEAVRRVGPDDLIAAHERVHGD